MLHVLKCFIFIHVFCSHDDSENSLDYFRFRITPILEGELPEKIDQLRNVSVLGVLNISIVLRKFLRCILA